MPYRKFPLKEGEIYHICTKSISKFIVFNTDVEFQRMLDTTAFYMKENQPCKFSDLPKPALGIGLTFPNAGLGMVDIFAYCIMPTHIHLLLKQLKEHGISRFMNLILKSYSKYFNVKHNRKGPLWEGRFKKVLVETDEQLLHLTRYIHLNPVTAHLVDKPEDWKWSSYQEYIFRKNESIYRYNDVLDVKPDSYKIFVENRISYQRELAKIKHLMLD